MELSPEMEDYLEAIHVICGDQGSARVKEVAHRLGVTQPSVVGALRSLKQRDLVSHEPYGAIHLTASGERIAAEVLERHRVLAGFLEEVLGLDAITAGRDACRIEHVVDAETIRRLRAMATFLQSSVHDDLDWPTEFRRYLDESSEIS